VMGEIDKKYLVDGKVKCCNCSKLFEYQSVIKLGTSFSSPPVCERCFRILREIMDLEHKIKP